MGVGWGERQRWVRGERTDAGKMTPKYENQKPRYTPHYYAYIHKHISFVTYVWANGYFASCCVPSSPVPRSPPSSAHVLVNPLPPSPNFTAKSHACSAIYPIFSFSNIFLTNINFLIVNRCKYTPSWRCPLAARVKPWALLRSEDLAAVLSHKRDHESPPHTLQNLQLLGSRRINGCCDVLSFLFLSCPPPTLIIPALSLNDSCAPHDSFDPYPPCLLEISNCETVLYTVLNVYHLSDSIRQPG